MGTVITGMSLGFANSGMTVSAQDIDAGEDNLIGQVEDADVDFTIATGNGSLKITECIVDFEAGLAAGSNVRCVLLSDAAVVLATGNKTEAGAVSAGTNVIVPITSPAGGLDISNNVNEFGQVEILVTGPPTT